MTNSPPFRPTRAPRVSLHGTLCVTVLLENGRKLPAKLHQLSVTGGLLELSAYLDERTKISLTLPVGENILYPKAEMLFPLGGAFTYLQPFRITGFNDGERQILETEIARLLNQTVARSTAGPSKGFRPPPFYLDSH